MPEANNLVRSLTVDIAAPAELVWAVLIDLQQHRSDGKIFGYAGSSFDELSNFPVSSYCQVLNRTEYPDA